MNTRNDLQKEAQLLRIQYALLRWENALVMALALILTLRFPRPLPGWPLWAWLFLGLVGVSGIVLSSLTDSEANARLLSQLEQGEFDLREIRDGALRRELERTMEYQRRIGAQVQKQAPGIMRDRLEETAGQVSSWVGNIFALAQRLDAYKADSLLRQERQSVPSDVGRLEARLQREADLAIRERIQEVIDAKRSHLDSLQALDARMNQAQLAMEQSMTALATIYSQLQLISAQEISSGNAERMRANIQEQILRLNDLVASINAVYDYGTEGLS